MKLDVTKPATAKSIYFWNSMGSLANASLSVLLLLMVVRILGENAGDVFSLGFSVATLMWSVANFETVTFQATDLDDRYTFGQFYAVKLWLYGISVVAGTVYALAMGWDRQKVAAVFLLCVYKCADAFSGVYTGALQKRDRLDLFGKSCTGRSLFGMALFCISMLVTRHLAVSLLIMTAFAVVWVFTVDVWLTKPFERVRYEGDRSAMWRILTACFPLFVGSFVLNYIANEPKYAMERFFPEATGSQTAFSVVLMPVFVINLLSMFIFRPVITRMAADWKKGDTARFARTTLRLVLAVVGLTAVALPVGWGIGIPVIEWVFGIDLQSFRVPFMLLLLGGGGSALITFLYNIFAAIRRQKSVLILFAAAGIAERIVCPLLVKRYAVMGAAAAYAGVLLLTAAAFMVTARFLIKKGKRDNEVR